jgi:hypothetical protein
MNKKTYLSERGKYYAEYIEKLRITPGKFLQRILFYFIILK